MLVLDQTNTYGFSNMTVTVTDNTYDDVDTSVSEREVPLFNFLIPTVQSVGQTNMMELYLPGELDLYVSKHGLPNPLKWGFGPDFIHGILSKNAPDVGVYTVNLRGPSATCANIIVLFKYRVETEVPYVDADGNQYYKDENGQLTTEPVDGGAIVRDVLHIRIETASATGIRKWVELLKAMEAMATTEPDDQGYITIPWFGVMYRGTTAYGNNTYFNMIPARAEYDGNMYYQVNVFDGLNMRSTDPTLSFDQDAGIKYGDNYYMEQQFNDHYPTLRYITAEDGPRIPELVGQYLYTVDDYLNDRMDEPSMTWAEIDPFTVNTFGVVVDSGSLNAGREKAFSLKNGEDGTETRDELYQMFFEGKIITDIASPIRYHANYIPDLGFNMETKRAMVDLMNRRIRMTVGTIMLGDDSGFSSAILEHQGHWYEDNPRIRQIPACQSPMMYNQFIRRTVTYPATYFDTMALVDNIVNNGNPFEPFAGARARWTGFIEDTLMLPEETPQYVNSLHNNRINVLMVDTKEGGYLHDQLMNTRRTSDQTELNNEILITCMLYDLVQLVHENHFKFNEAAEVQLFSRIVEDRINARYKQYAASLSCEVYRVGTVGRARFRNKILVTIDMKDISKYTDVELYLIDA